MDTLKCRAFCEAARLGSILAASGSMGYTPSGINRMINALEDELSVTLLSRGRGGVKLTGEGSALLPLIREYVRLDDEVLQCCSDFNGLLRGDLTIGSFYSVAAHVLPRVTELFLSTYPGINIRVIEDGAGQLLDMLKARAVDCCIIDDPTDSSYTFEKLFEDEIVAWLPKGHPLAVLPAVPVREIGSYPFVAMSEGKRSATRHALEEAGVSYDIKYTTEDSYTGFRMVEAGLGISVNNALTSARWQGDVEIRPLEPAAKVDIGLVTLSGVPRSAAARRFTDMLKEYFDQAGGKPR